MWKAFLLVALVVSPLVGAAPASSPAAETVYDDLKSRCKGALEAASEGVAISFEEGLSGIFELEPTGYRTRWLRRPAGSLWPYSRYVVNRVEKQAEHVAQFLRDLYLATPFTELQRRPFRSVQIVPSNLFGAWRTLDLVQDVLYVRMGYRVVSSHELLAMWKAGYQYAWGTSERRLWKYVNPAGFYMKLTKPLLREAGKVLGEGLSALTQTPSPEPLADRAVALLRQGLGISAETEFPLESRLRGMEDSELRQWLSQVGGLVTSEGQINNLVSTAKTDEDSNRLEITIIDTWMIHGNFHWIPVTAGSGGEVTRMILNGNPDSGAVVKNGRLTIIGSKIGTYSVDIVDVRAFSGKLLLASALEASLTP